MMVNRALANAALPVIENSRNHDGWLAMVAGVTGEIGFLDEPTMYYRRHDTTVSNFGKTHRPQDNPDSWEAKVARVSSRLNSSVGLAKMLRTQVGDKMPEDRREVLDKFISLENEPRYIRGAKLLAQGYTQPTLKATIGSLFWR